MEQQPSLTIREAATRLNVSRQTVYRMMNDKELPWFTVRGVRRILQSAIEHIENGLQPAKEEGV